MSEATFLETCFKLRGKKLLYPCAGSDVTEPFKLFAPYLDELIFVDINYQFHRPKLLSFTGWTEDVTQASLVGPPSIEMAYIKCNDLCYREMKPAWFSRTYVNDSTRHKVKVTLRRGFGQYALNELGDHELGVFFHRGDSSGEGGSNVFYFGNRPSRHPPLANLLEKIQRKLAYPAIVVSDGSNADVRQLRRASSSNEGFFEPFKLHNLLWEPIWRAPFFDRFCVYWRVSRFDDA